MRPCWAGPADAGGARAARRQPLARTRRAVGQRVRRHHLDLGEAHRPQHRHDGRRVGPPPVGPVLAQLLAGVEGHRGAAAQGEVHLGLQDQQVAGHAGHALERQQRVAQVVEHAEEEHHVERAHLIGATGPSRRSRGPRTAEPRASRASSKPRLPVPSPWACHEKLSVASTCCRAAPLGLEGVEAVPRADVEHRPARQIRGQAHLLQPRADRGPAPG